MKAYQEFKCKSISIFIEPPVSLPLSFTILRPSAVQKLLIYYAWKSVCRIDSLMEWEMKQTEQQIWNDADASAAVFMSILNVFILTNH